MYKYLYIYIYIHTYVHICMYIDKSRLGLAILTTSLGIWIVLDDRMSAVADSRWQAVGT